MNCFRALHTQIHTLQHTFPHCPSPQHQLFINQSMQTKLPSCASPDYQLRLFPLLLFPVPSNCLIISFFSPYCFSLSYLLIHSPFLACCFHSVIHLSPSVTSFLSCPFHFFSPTDPLKLPMYVLAIPNPFPQIFFFSLCND